MAVVEKKFLWQKSIVTPDWLSKSVEPIKGVILFVQKNPLEIPLIL